MQPMKFRKKPVVIEAIQYNGENLEEIEKFAPISIMNNHPCFKFFVKTLEGIMYVTEGDYIIKGIKGEFYPCKPDIFELTYEKVENNG